MQKTEQETETPEQFANNTGYKTETIRKKLREGKLPGTHISPAKWVVFVPQAYEALKGNTNGSE